MSGIAGTNKGGALSLLDSIMGMFKTSGKRGKSAGNGMGNVLDQVNDLKAQGAQTLDQLQDVIPGQADDKIIDSIQEKLNMQDKQ